jgi:integrase
MKGHIRERSPGHWAIVIETRDPVTGKRKPRWHSFRGTKRAAQIRCAELIAEMQGGRYLEPSRTTLAQYFDRWLDHMKSQVSPRSHERYAEIARKNLIPLLGAVLLSKLQPVHISTAYATALARGRRDGKGGLSPRTVHHMHRVLKQAVGQAVKWRLLAHNPADLVKPPKVERKEMQSLNADGLVEFIEAARTAGAMFMAVLLAALCGLRRGEIAAVRWRSIDLERAQLSVVASTEQTEEGIREKETKSGRNRTVALPSIVVDELRRHRLAQAETLLRLGVRLTDDHHVCAREDGEPFQPHSISAAFRKFIQRRGLQQIRFHDLRHSHATQMLASGVHPKIAQERLGHSSISVTLDLYSHVMPGMQEDAAARVDAAMEAALQKRGRKLKG